MTRLLLVFHTVEGVVELSMRDVQLTPTQKALIGPISQTKCNTLTRLVYDRWIKPPLGSSKDERFPHDIQEEEKRIDYVIHTSWSPGDSEREVAKRLRLDIPIQTIIDAFEPDDSGCSYVIYAAECGPFKGDEPGPWYKTVYTDAHDMLHELECFQCGGCEVKVYRLEGGERHLMTEEELDKATEPDGDDQSSC